MRVTRGELLAGVLLDLSFGDPQWLPHPVRAIGFWAGKAELFWRKTSLPLKIAGGCFSVSVIGATVELVHALPRRLNTYWIYSLLACRDLDVHALRVISALERGDLGDARLKLAAIVGRDTDQLNESEIVRAVIESVAENLSDGVVAPLFYLAVGGTTGMAAYKSINTLDSMVGHRNARYKDFGLVSAKLDDFANFVPARLTAALIWCVALLPGFSAARAVKTTVRDARNQPSPNAGYPEAAVAGALGVQLGGLNFYAGVPSQKATLGDAAETLQFSHYRKVRVLLYAVEALLVGSLVWWSRPR